MNSIANFSNDTLAERLRRRPAKPMGSPRVGSNPTGVVLVMAKLGHHNKHNMFHIRKTAFMLQHPI